MTNSAMLKDKIRKSGLKICFIAKSIGVSRASLYKKMNNVVPFNQYEMEKMCKILGIVDLAEKEQIFFAMM